MATQTKEAPSTKVVTGVVRLSYAHVWEPAAIGEEDKEKKYSGSLIIPKSDKVTLGKIKRAIEAAKEAGKAKLGKKANSPGLKTPLRDGDEERDDDEAYENAYFLNATSKTKPGIVDKDLNKVMDRDEVYSGCFVRASINFYAFNTKGNIGIACGLNHIQKVKDGEPLSGRGSAEDDFSDDFEIDDDDIDTAPAPKTKPKKKAAVADDDFM